MVILPVLLLDHRNLLLYIIQSSLSLNHATKPEPEFMSLRAGAFGWNPPFPPNENNATNVKGAMPPDSAEYWNYGSDEDFSGAALWNGKKFAPPAAAANSTAK
jgi:hypothetical protein